MMSGGKPIIIIYTYINNHGVTPKQRQNHTGSLDVTQLCCIGVGVGLENRGNY